MFYSNGLDGGLYFSLLVSFIQQILLVILFDIYRRIECNLVGNVSIFERAFYYTE